MIVGYNEIDFVRLMILFKADDDRVNEWLDSEMIGSRKLTNAELIKASNIEEMAQILADISMDGGYEFLIDMTGDAYLGVIYDLSNK